MLKKMIIAHLEHAHNYHFIGVFIPIYEVAEYTKGQEKRVHCISCGC
jgi:hypothetical protein